MGMYQQRNRRYCAMLLAVSVCLRLCMFLGLDAKAIGWATEAAKSETFARWMLFLESGRLGEAVETEAETELYVLRILEPQVKQQPETAVMALPAVASAEQLSLAGACTYPVDKAALLAQPSRLTSDGLPKVLIVHTHGSEAYTPEPGLEYEPAGDYRTLDSTRSVVQVGRVLAQTLEAQGIEVIHDETMYDQPSFNDAYGNALRGIQKQLEADPDIGMVLDIHRDAVEDAGGNAVALSAESGGESCARLMLVVGTDQGGLSHPGWQENLANALKLQAVLQGSEPGLCRSLDLRTERFNQHTTAGSLLVEVGTNGNTLTQALRSAERLGTALGQLLHALSQTGGYLQALP